MTTPPLDLPALRARIERAKERPVPPGLAGILALDALDLLARVEELADENTRWRNRAESVATARNILHVERENLTARAVAAEAKVAAVREALEAHPKACDRHTEDDPIKCGWKRAVADVTRALGGGA